MKEIYEAIGVFHKEVELPSMDKTNPHKNYKYADLASVLKCIKAPLEKAGLSITQIPFNTETGIGIRTTIMHTSGQMLESEWFIPCDMNNKNIAQDYGKNITYIRRYSLMSMLGLCGDNDDNDGELPSKPKTPHYSEAMHKLVKRAAGLGFDEKRFIEVVSGYLDKVQDHIAKEKIQ